VLNQVSHETQLMPDRPERDVICPLDGPTDESIAFHKAQADREIASLPPLSSTVLSFPSKAQEELDTLFTAPSALERVHLLQTAESLKAQQIASDLSLHLTEEPMGDLDRKQKALMRYLATSVLRRSQVCWESAAHKKAQQAVATAMREEGGKAFRSLPEAHIEALAVLLTSRVLTAYHGITEGSTALAPGLYLRIVNGGCK
jgi:hypothetical protein